jgi:arginine-tRNA-protein transferase
MLVDYFSAPILQHDLLDEKLADGWFRSGHLMFRTKVLCIDEALASVVNIRLPLAGYQMPKRMRKIYRRVQGGFRTEIGPLKIDEALEGLYRLHRERFVGFLYSSLTDLFGESSNLAGAPSPFQTYMVRVYAPDGELAAASLFDIGQHSLASIIGLFHPGYAKHSLGTYTMLAEVAHAQSLGMAYFYPGYVLDTPSVFDYKLKLGESMLEVYNWKGQWSPWPSFNPSEYPGHFLRQELDRLERALRQAGVPFRKLVYVAFPAGYFPTMEYLLRAPVCYECESPSGEKRIASYNWEEQCFELAVADEFPMPEMRGMELSDQWKNNPIFYTHMLEVVEIHLRGSAKQVAQALLRD